jgi:hypothetical protein
MCGECYPATRATMALAYAIPVDIVDLGVSLMAYERIKPAIRTLRLCHRFGKGAKVRSMNEVHNILPQPFTDCSGLYYETAARTVGHGHWRLVQSGEA